jgi:hypothetical protein
LTHLWLLSGLILVNLAQDEGSSCSAPEGIEQR